MEADTAKQQTNREKIERIKPWQFQPGQSGNPSGRPKGSSLKVWVQNMLAAMSDEERLQYLNGISKTEIWKMGEGAPETKADITSKGEKLTSTLIPEVLNQADNLLKEKKLNDS